MNRHLIGIVAATLINVSAFGPALGDDSRLRAVRVDANDVESLAAFYSESFGLQVTRRIETEAFLELVMNFGGSVEEAQANARPSLVIISRPEGAEASPVMAVIFGVTDMESAMARVVARGGSIDGGPQETQGITYVLARDPEGNRIELIAE